MPDIHARGVRFNVLTMGDAGPTLVFVHGVMIDNLSSFYLSIAPALAKSAQVILYDLRGHGRSEQPPAGYTTDDMADDLAGILDALALRGRRVIVVGHSFGGYIALRFATRHPEYIAGLVLLEAHSGMADFGAQMQRTMALDGEERNELIQKLFGNWLTKHAARGQAVPVPADPEQVDLSSLDADRRSTVAMVGRLQRRRRSPLVESAQRLAQNTSFGRDIAAVVPLPDATIAAIACPVLALYGAQSDLVPDGRRLARVLPNCTLQMIEGCAHGILFHATVEVRDAMLAWLSATWPRAARE